MNQSWREMRRMKQALAKEECVAILRRATAGVLAVSGDDGYPYAVPLSFAYHDGEIYFHCAKEGHKLDAIARSDKASFCVVDQDAVVPERFTTYYRSVITFGRVRVLANDQEKRAALEILAEKYSPDQQNERISEIEKSLDRVCMLALSVEHMTGKEAIELTRRREG